MAHELSIRPNGFVETAYVGNVGWHGLGQKLEAGASIEEWIKAAGMDWRILRGKVRYNTVRVVEGATEDVKNFRTLDNQHVLFRSDTKVPLSIVSKKYKVVQPKEILEFFRDLTATMGFVLDTAGVLFDGKKFWAMAKVGEALTVGAGDVHKPYVLLCTSCDGSMQTEGRKTDERVVCSNTMEFARSGSKAESKISHRMTFDASKMKKEMGLEVREQFADFIEQMRRLAEVPMHHDEVIEMTANLFVPGCAKLAAEEYKKIIDSRPVTKVCELVLDGKAMGSKLPGVQGTVYGWLNGVTEFVDHHARAHSPESRQASAWFGKGEAIKTRAFEMVESF